MAGVWDHPIKLLDGFWFGLSFAQSNPVHSSDNISWLTQASRWCITAGGVQITYHLADLEVVREEYGVDDYEGMVVRLRLRNRGKASLACTLHFLARTDLRAAWLGENRLAWRDGQDRAMYLDECACIAAYNTVNPAFVLFGAKKRPTTVATGPDLWATKQTRGQGISGQLTYSLNLPAGTVEDIVFIIAGSTRSSESAIATFKQLQAAPDDFCQRQRRRYMHIVERCDLHCDDELMDTAFGWAKMNLQMLERRVPGIGRGIAAGLPDYPWWFGKDTTYSALPLLASGQFELALTSLRNLAQHSKANNPYGGIVHEILTQGHVHDTGHLVEVLLFVRACYHAFRWTGDFNFLHEMYSFCKHSVLDFVLGLADPDGDLCAMGKGLIESRELQNGNGFETLDIAAYTYEALLSLAELAQAADDTAIVPDLRGKAQRLRTYVNTAWWIEEEGLFGDIYTSAAALSASNQALRAEGTLSAEDVNELDHTQELLAAHMRPDGSFSSRERPWLLKHTIVATPMETKLASPAHAEQAFSRLESDEFTGPWGLYLNPDRQHATMTLPTGMLAVAEAQYQRMDQALSYSHRIASTLFYGMPGAFSDLSPDDGCFIQAWSSYGIIWPVVDHFLGFRPNAPSHSLCFIPHLPASWHTVRLQAVRVGFATINLAVDISDHEQRIVLETSDREYDVTLGCIGPLRQEPTSVLLNGEAVVFHADPLEQDEEYNTSAIWQKIYTAHLTGQARYELYIHW
jgi:glycogen debranching enzyme